MNKILIVGGEFKATTFLLKSLQRHGFVVTAMKGDSEISVLYCINNFDLLLLNMDLFYDQGLKLLERLRRQGEALPIIILTSRSSLSDKVSGLETGANDYVVKPFHFEELFARIRVWLRKSRIPNSETRKILKDSNISIDLRTRQVWIEERLVNLSNREFNLAKVLFHYPGQVLSREKLINCVWGYNYAPDSNIVDVYIGHLRRKLGRNLIKTKKGMGYYLQI
jgi:DNA-binding response OmpR family regulator